MLILLKYCSNARTCICGSLEILYCYENFLQNNFFFSFAGLWWKGSTCSKKTRAGFGGERKKKGRNCIMQSRGYWYVWPFQWLDGQVTSRHANIFRDCLVVYSSYVYLLSNAGFCFTALCMFFFFFFLCVYIMHMWAIDPEGQTDGSLQHSKIILINGGRWDTQVMNYHFPKETYAHGF